MKKPELVIPNDVNLAKGEFKGTWSGRRIRIGNVTEILVDKSPRGINVPVILIVKEHVIEIYVN